MNGRADRRKVDRLRRGPVALGLRRVTWVRISVADGVTSCRVVGSGHRGMRTRRVPLATALRLHAGGVPTVFRSSGRPAATSGPVG